MGFVDESPATSRPYRSALREEQAERTKLLIARAGPRAVRRHRLGRHERPVGRHGGRRVRGHGVCGLRHQGRARRHARRQRRRDADVERLLAELGKATGTPAASWRPTSRSTDGCSSTAVTACECSSRGCATSRPSPPPTRRAGAAASGAVAGRVLELAGLGPARGVSLQRALDAYAMVVSIQVYDIAVLERGLGRRPPGAVVGRRRWPSRSSPDPAPGPACDRRTCPRGWRQPTVARVTMTT